MKQSISHLLDERYLTSAQANALVNYSKAVTGQEAPSGETPDAESLWLIAPRVSQVIAEILDEGIATKPWFKWPQLIFLHAGRILWLLVEATVPQRPFRRALNYWYQILFTVTLLLFILGHFFGGLKGAIEPTSKLLWMLLAVWMVIATIRKGLYRKYRVWINTTYTVTLIAAVLNLFVGYFYYDIDILDAGSDVRAIAVILISMSLIVGVVIAWICTTIASLIGRKKTAKSTAPTEKGVLAKAFQGVCNAVVATYLGLILTVSIWLHSNREHPVPPTWSSSVDAETPDQAKSQTKGIEPITRDGQPQFMPIEPGSRPSGAGGGLKGGKAGSGPITGGSGAPPPIFNPGSGGPMAPTSAEVPVEKGEKMEGLNKAVQGKIEQVWPFHRTKSKYKDRTGIEPRRTESSK